MRLSERIKENLVKSLDYIPKILYGPPPTRARNLSYFLMGDAVLGSPVAKSVSIGLASLVLPYIGFVDLKRSTDQDQDHYCWEGMVPMLEAGAALFINKLAWNWNKVYKQKPATQEDKQIVIVGK